MDISKLDSNFTLEQVDTKNITFYSSDTEAFSIYGIHKEDGVFVRMPKDIAKSVSEGVNELNLCTAGGRVRFMTNSKKIVIACRADFGAMMDHMTEVCRCGFDLYADSVYHASFRPPINFKNGYMSAITFETSKLRDIIINFPLYNGVRELEIGLEKDATLKAGNKYKIKKPVVFYGSSITQGGCASRPGNSYQSVLSRRLDFDYINLGFSGNAKAEDEIADYIANLEMSAFVYDYDHNAPTVDHLKNTHYKMYKKIRAKNNNIPIILASAPAPCWSQEETHQRIDIIKNTFDRARESGDNNIYFINGMEIFKKYDSNMMTVDGCHPTDFGFYCMAESFEEILKNVL